MKIIKLNRNYKQSKANRNYRLLKTKEIVDGKCVEVYNNALDKNQNALL